MRIGVDATCWHNQRGYGRHARALLGELFRAREHRYTLVVDAPLEPDSAPEDVELRVVRSSAPTSLAAAANGHRSLADMWRMSRALSQVACDVLLFPSVYSFVPVWTRAKKLVVIHDVIAERFPRHTLPNPRARWFWRAKVALARRQADALATVSEYSKRCLVEHFGVPAERVHVVGEAADPVFRRLDQPAPTERLRGLALDGRQRIIVYLGGFGPHKNLEVLVEAFDRAVRRDEASAEGGGDAKPPMRLVLVGENRSEVFHSYFATIEAELRRRRLWDRVVCTGYLPDSDVVALLNLATVLVLPSLMEGFGLPAVEAAACGCPVIATTESPLPALLGEGGQFVDPHDQEGWNSALWRALTDEGWRQSAAEAAAESAARLSWSAAARQMQAVFEEVVDS